MRHTRSSGRGAGFGVLRHHQLRPGRGNVVGQVTSNNVSVALELLLIGEFGLQLIEIVLEFLVEALRVFLALIFTGFALLVELRGDLD